MTWPTIFDQKLSEFNVMELPGQHLASSHAATPLDHALNLDIYGTPGCQKLTGIMASMGTSTNNVQTLQKMMEAGMNMAFMNMSFGTRAQHIETIKNLREAAKNHSINMGKTFPIAIAMWLCGRKIRTGQISDMYGTSVELETGSTLRVTTDDAYKERCSMYNIYVDFVGLADQLHVGDTIFISNESIELKVEMISTTTLTCKVLRGGILGSNRDVFIPNVVLDMPILSEKDKSDIELAIHYHIDIIIAAFTNRPGQITELRKLLERDESKIAIIASIQTVEGFRNFDEILKVSDGILVTRLELGSDFTPPKLVVAQKNMVARANKANVPVGICAELLSSMVKHRVPLRAELLDVANCILDGADFLVLSAETAVGMYPVETVASVTTACKDAETCIWSKQILTDFIEKTPIPCDQMTSTAIAAVMASQRCLAAAIIVLTTFGVSAAKVAKYRPRCPIIAVTRHPATARQLHMYRAVIPLIFEEPPDTVWTVDVGKRIGFGVKFAMDQGFARNGDPIVAVFGWKLGSGFTNSLRVIYASEKVLVY